MNNTSFKTKLRNAAYRLNGKNSYEVTFNAPSFKVKSLCIEGIPIHSMSNTCSKEAIDKALASVGSLSGKNKADVLLRISLRNGVQIISRKDKRELVNYELHQVGYCNVDKRYPQIFSFVAGKETDDLKCHAFLCHDGRSREICTTMVTAFKNANENYQKSKEMSNSKNVNNLQLTADIVSTGIQNGEQGNKNLYVKTDAKVLIEKGRNKKSDERLSDAESFDAVADGLLFKSAEKGTYSLLRSDNFIKVAKHNDIQEDLITWE